MIPKMEQGARLVWESKLEIRIMWKGQKELPKPPQNLRRKQF